MVVPVGNEPYLAAAKLDISGPSYSIAQLFDDPVTFNPLDDDNPNLTGLREIEVDVAGNVYVANAHAHNESDMLWKYAPDGSVINSINLRQQANVTSPIGMYISKFNNMLYLASSLTPADSNSTEVYGFSTADLILQRTVDVNGMGHVTSITEDPITGTLWVAGFSMAAPPDYPDPYALPFYEPFMADVPLASNNVQALSLNGAGDLALPLSIVWTGTDTLLDSCGGADFDDSNDVDFFDFEILMGQWQQPPVLPSADIAPGVPDNIVNELDLAALADRWLQTGCQQ